MEALVPDLLSQPAEGIENYLKKLRSKSDLIACAASHSVANSTVLLEILKELPVHHCAAGYALFLSFQTETLPDSANLLFLSVANMFFAGATKASVCFVPEEGANSYGMRLTSVFDL